MKSKKVILLGELPFVVIL